MNESRQRPSPLLLFAMGASLGALSWLAARIASGHFEPYDSGIGLLTNQILISVPAIVLAWRSGAAATFLFMIGAYVGMNLYSYSLGGSESRAWALLGAASALFLLLVPATLALGTVAFRRMRRMP